MHEMGPSQEPRAGRIRVLPDRLVDQIAAGEVVERPASVVKELVENALDARARRVDVVVREGGLAQIAVADDGIGMRSEDAHMAFTRHATSKIDSLDALCRVETMGFRGEALPSIASVAVVTLRTRTAGDAVGTEIHIDAQGELASCPVACPIGTRVEVTDLFGRIPARRKFMRAAATEARHIARGLESVALARPELRLSLERDGKPSLLFLPTAEQRERLLAALPARVGEQLVTFDTGPAAARARGFASPTGLMRSHANDIHLFVNRRPVRDRMLMHAVRAAYRDALPPGQHPVVVLYLEIDPTLVDVNVHPAKAEVRFREPDAVRRVVVDGVRSALVRERSAAALALADRAAPPWQAPRSEGPLRAADDAPPISQLGGTSALHGTGTQGAVDDAAAGRTAKAAASARPLLPFVAVAPRAGDPGADGTGRAPAVSARPLFGDGAERVPFSAHRYVGQVLRTYLVLEGPRALVLVDQHAAHERVLFEQIRAATRRGGMERQPLLIPVWLELSRSAADALQEHAGALVQSGYELEWGGSGVRGGVRIGIKTVPAVFQARLHRAGEAPDWVALLEETAGALIDPDTRPDAYAGRDGVDAALHHVLATAACHSACRKGDRLDDREVATLLAALDREVWIPSCPHGRPIALTLTDAELLRRFLRS
jgi:DNA mismatch repair protein MutL